MRDPFLCSDCQKHGYCQKYNTNKNERMFDENEQEFYHRVNIPSKKTEQAPIGTSMKLTSLEKIRNQFRKQDSIFEPASILFHSQSYEALDQRIGARRKTSKISGKAKQIEIPNYKL